MARNPFGFLLKTPHNNGTSTPKTEPSHMRQANTRNAKRAPSAQPAAPAAPLSFFPEGITSKPRPTAIHSSAASPGKRSWMWVLLKKGIGPWKLGVEGSQVAMSNSWLVTIQIAPHLWSCVLADPAPDSKTHKREGAYLELLPTEKGGLLHHTIRRDKDGATSGTSC